MKLAIPANWADDFLDKMNFSYVYEVYGKLPGDFIGGGRASVLFHKVSESTFKNQVDGIRKKGISFNYLLNASCIDNLEFTKKGYRKIIKLIEMISKAGVNVVTVALPQLIPMIKNVNSELKISISTNCMVDNLERVRYWEEIGADKITLSYTDVNRDFKELKRIAKYKKCDVQLICNLICRKHCPFQFQHSNFHSHASQTEHVNNRFPVDYYCMLCNLRSFTNPYDVIKAAWIRPEDLQAYENIGIEYFKLAERGMNTDDLALIVEAYTQKSYEGNFMDLIPTMSKYHYISNVKQKHFVNYFIKPFKAKVKSVRHILEMLLKLKEQKAYYKHMGIYIDNKKLDGFVDHFISKSCNNTVCEECRYCEKWSKQVISVTNPEQKKEAQQTFDYIVKNLTSGELF